MHLSTGSVTPTGRGVRVRKHFLLLPAGRAGAGRALQYRHCISIKETNENLMRMGWSSLYTLRKLAYKTHSPLVGYQTHSHTHQHIQHTQIKMVKTLL